MLVISKSLKTPMHVIFLLAARSCICDDHSRSSAVPANVPSLIQRSRDKSISLKLLQAPQRLDAQSKEDFDGDDHSDHEIPSDSSTALLRIASRMCAKRAHSTGLLFCRHHPCSLLLTKESEASGPGESAPLTEAGYKSVADLRDDHHMKKFILRVMRKLDCQLVDEGGLMGIIPWFSGTIATQSLENLEGALLFEILGNGKPWLLYKNSGGITGDNAPLDDEGYILVACLRSDMEMKKFAYRICRKSGVKITDKGGFADMLRFFRTSASFRSLDMLVSEIEAAATASSWASFE